jgi:Holliday junction DNA helicase RuvA
MIDYIRGTLTVRLADAVVIDVQGIGYRVFTPNPYRIGEGALDVPVTVYTHMHVREDAMVLFGFAERAEQAMFRRLLEVSGIGPRVALGVLTGATPAEIAAHIKLENVTALTKLPGIGKKTAQRMVLDLKDKVDEFAPEHALLATYSSGLVTAADIGGLDGLSGAAAEGGLAWQETRDGLMALGYTAAELDRAYDRLKDTIAADEPVDALMKRTLQQLFKA